MPKYIDMLRRGQKPGSEDKESLLEEEELLVPPPPSAKPAPSNRSLQQPPSGRQRFEDTSQPSANMIDNAQELIAECSRVLLAFFKAASSQKPVPINKLWQHLKPQITNAVRDAKIRNALELKVGENPQQFRDMSKEFGSMLEKSINMLLLGIKIGNQLRMDEDAILSLLFAGMFHQAGLARVPVGIREKAGALNQSERKIIRSSANAGIEYLRSCGVTDQDILLAIGQSHERIDGSGPQGLKEGDISYLGRTLGLLSFFEALIHFRPYRQRLLPRDAIREIILNHKQAFDINLLKALIDAVSLYPIGTYVQLNTGEMGRVVHVHPRLPLRPIVLLDLDANGQPIKQRQVDLQAQTTLQVQRCMYPEDLEKAL